MKAQYKCCFNIVPAKTDSPTRLSSTPSSITLSLPQLNTGSYTIKWNSPTNNGSKTGINRKTTINGLASNTAYSFIAQNSAGAGLPSDPVTISTGLF